MDVVLWLFAVHICLCGGGDAYLSKEGLCTLLPNLHRGGCWLFVEATTRIGWDFLGMRRLAPISIARTNNIGVLLGGVHTSVRQPMYDQVACRVGVYP